MYVLEDTENKKYATVKFFGSIMTDEKSFSGQIGEFQVLISD